MPNEQEQRRGQRADTELEVDLATVGPYFLSKFTNLSTSGAFICTHELLDIGKQINLRFKLPTQEAIIETKAEVIWIYKQAGDIQPNSTGMGVRFLQLDDGDRDQIQRYVEAILGHR